ncbi:hypothetical protein GCM10011487_57290 [Steroidobacter agaridevorans]|uniref:Uncharacterized protein n=1 Tax=Steroidobacter agaridevorans TaxID=2695856 RepID=A0A829YKK6_9GAMM|nr:hypothetical protein GCM10011487_57290 [Steroidobacter agaridevorans]
MRGYLDPKEQTGSKIPDHVLELCTLVTPVRQEPHREINAVTQACHYNGIYGENDYWQERHFLSS